MKFASFKSSALKSVGAVSLCVALGAGLVGCGGNGAGGGAVAATVNGQEIMEQTVTDYIANFRTSSSLESDEAWGEWMVANGYTPESVREEVIDYYVNQDLYDQAAKEYNVTVEQADIDAALDETKAMFESDEAFQEALEASSMTEESYIEDVIRPNLLQTKLAEAVAAQDTEGEGDDATLAQAQAMSEQFNGAKRSSHILLTAEEGEDDAALAARAQELLDQINAGEISFEDAASQYSTDTGSAANGGDVGWDALSTFVTEYQDALAGLEKDQIVAAPVKSEYGYHIIKVTDVYEVPEGGITSVDQLPTEFQDSIRAMLQSSNQSNAYYSWLEEQRNAADVQINDMPEGLPYWVDMANYPKEESSEDSTGVTAVDADGNPIVLDEGAVEGEGAGEQVDASAEGEEPVAEGVDEGAEGAEDAAAVAADEAAADAEGAAPVGDDAEQPTEGAAEGIQPAETPAQ